MVSSILCTMGLRVGSTVSPHLTEYRERFLVQGEPISADDLTALGRRVAGRLDPDPASAEITFFELGVALALTWFAEQSVDAAVVEVGMGGEFDATRACDPVVAALVSVDMDHVRHLGPTLDDIARTKARVAQRGGTLVVGETRPDRIAPILEEATALGASVVCRGVDFHLRARGDGLRFEGLGLDVSGIRLGLRGAHQQGNAATATASVLAFCDAMGVARPSGDQIREGLGSACIAGRLERMQCPGSGAAVLLDGAHNAAGARALADTLAGWERPVRRVWLYAAMSDKDRAPILDALLPHVDEVWCTAGSSTPRFADPEILAREVTTAGGRACVLQSPAVGVQRAAAELTPDEELLVAGSLYLVGDARPLLLPPT